MIPPKFPPSIVNSPVVIVPHHEINNPQFREIISTEPHITNRIVRYAGHDTLYWEKANFVALYLDAVAKAGEYSFEDVVNHYTKLGFTKNSDIYRQLYRDAGCSLFDYYETFYMPNDTYNPSEYIAGKN